MKRRFLLILTALAALNLPAAAQFYSIPWTGDASAGVTTANTVWAYNFGTATNATVNGVTFTGVAGSAPSVANRFAVTGTNFTFTNDGTSLPAGSGSATVAKDFISNARPAVITLSGLNAGQVYSLHVYSAGFGADPREAIWASDAESARFDQTRFGDNNGVRITYSFSPRNSTKTITITPLAFPTWHLCGIALTTGPTFEPVVPTISAAAASTAQSSWIISGNEQSFRFTSPASPFIEFDFGASRTVDTFINVTEKETTAANRLSDTRIIFDTDGNGVFNAGTDTVVNFNAANTGSLGMGFINRFTPVTARRARWEALTYIGTPTVGTMEMAFLQSPTGSVAVSPSAGFISSATAPFSNLYTTPNAWNGLAGFGDLFSLEYATGLQPGAERMAVTFDLGSDLPVSGFDYFDRITTIYQTPTFDVDFLDAAGVSIPGTRKSYTKASWLKSDHFAPITCRRIKLTATSSSLNGFPGVGDFAIYRHNPVVDVTFGPVAATAIRFDGATVGGSVSTTGTAPITERGIVFARTADNANPQVGGAGVTKVTVSGTTGAFSGDLGFLAGSTGYTYRTYASDSGGVVFSYSAAQTFTTSVAPPPTFTDSSNVGLWIGEVELNQVVSDTEVTLPLASTPAPFRYTIIMHVDLNGYARLLPEATLMQTRTVPALPVIITQSALLGNFDGITLRGGKPVGQRFSASNFPPPPTGTNLSYDGSTWITGSISLDAAHPLNPFRHKYHPDLGTGRTVRRDYRIAPNSGDSRSDHIWSGAISDSVTGISKRGLESRGTVTFTRVSNAGKLNQP